MSTAKQPADISQTDASATEAEAAAEAAEPTVTKAAQDETIKSSFKFDALTGLRFFAAFFVFVGHCDQFFFYDPTGTLRQMSLGACVTLFFVLSGFVLTHAYDELPTSTSVKDFLVARLAKIWPIHAVTLALFLVFVKTQPGDLDVPALLASIFLVQDWVPLRSIYICFNNPAWSLSVELFFYLAFPILITQRKRFLNLFFIASCLLTAGMIAGADFIFPQPAQEQFCHYFAYWCPLTRLVDFILGMQVYVIYSRYAHKLRELKLPWTLFEAGTISALLFWVFQAKHLSHLLLNHAAPETSRTGLEIWSASAAPAVVCAAIVLLAAIEKGLISLFLATKWMIAWGDRSFVLYMIHFSIFALILSSQVGWQPLPPMFLFGCVLLMVFLSSDFLFRAVEIPARQYIRSRWTTSPSRARQAALGRKTIALLTAEGVFLCVAACFFYFYPEIIHGRQLIAGSQSIKFADKFSDQYELENAYWETDGTENLLELNWRNSSVHTFAHQLLLQMLKDRNSSSTAGIAVKAKELQMEEPSQWRKNCSLKMRLYFAPADLAGASTIGLTLHSLNSADACKPGNGDRDLEQTRLLLQIPACARK